MLRYLFYLILFLLSLGQYSAIYKGSGASIYIFDIALVFVNIFGTIYLLNKKLLFIPKYITMFLLFCVVACMSLGVSNYRYSTDELFVSGLYCLRLLSYYYFGLIIYSMIKSGKVTKDQISSSLVYSGLFLGFMGLLQLVLLPDFQQLDSSLGWDPHKNRLASTFFDPNFVGAYFVIIFTLILDEALSKKQGTPLRHVLLLSIFLIFIVLTFSRSAWGMLAIVILLYGLFKNRTLLLAALLVVFLAYFLVPKVQTRISGVTDPADSAAFRLVSWKNTIQIIKENPIFGVGYNGYRYIQKDYGFLSRDNLYTHSGAGSDSSILFVVATTGIVGTVIFLAGLAYPIVDKKKQDLVLPVITIALIAESQFINSFFYPQIMFVFVVLLANYSISYNSR